MATTEYLLNQTENTTGDKQSPLTYYSPDFLDPRYPQLMGAQGLKTLRTLTIPAMLLMIGMGLYLMPWQSQLFFLVMWCNYIIIATSVLSMQVSAGNSGVRKATQYLIEYAMGAEVVVTLVFFPLIPAILTKNADQPLLIVYMFLVNIVPTVLIGMNVIFSKVRFEAGHWWFTLAVGAVFMVTNFAGCKIFNTIYYPFLPWDGSVKSFIMPLATIGMGTLIYLGTTWAVNKLPREKSAGKFQ